MLLHPLIDSNNWFIKSSLCFRATRVIM